MQKEVRGREMSQPTQVTASPTSARQRLWLGIYLGLVGLVLVALLISVWPAVERATQPAPAQQGQTGGQAEAGGQAQAGGQTPTSVRMSFFGLTHLRASAGTALIILVAIFGALGSFIHAGTSFVEYVGNRRLSRSWTWWYMLRIPIGATLALILYVAFRGGLFATSATTGDVNIYGVAALAALAGLFSKQATAKLEELFTTLFRVAEGKGDERLKDSLTHDRPVVTGTEPARLAAGEQVNLVVTGTGFVPLSQVRLRRVATGEVLERTTNFIDETRLGVTLPAEELAEAGQLELTVVTPPPGGGISEPRLVDIDPPSGTESTEPEPPPDAELEPDADAEAAAEAEAAAAAEVAAEPMPPEAEPDGEVPAQPLETPPAEPPAEPPTVEPPPAEPPPTKP
jgi:hypothetical protein